MEASTTVNQPVNQPADVSFETYTANTGIPFLKVENLQDNKGQTAKPGYAGTISFTVYEGVKPVGKAEPGKDPKTALQYRVYVNGKKDELWLWSLNKTNAKTVLGNGCQKASDLVGKTYGFVVYMTGNGKPGIQLTNLVGASAPAGA